jgi:DnaJ-class molecular chaperone
MDIREEVFNLRVRIATLDGQMAQAQAEASKLGAIPCPICEGSGNVIDETHPSESGVTYTKTCATCRGSGLACGERKY